MEHVSPNTAPTALDLRNRAGTSILLLMLEAANARPRYRGKWMVAAQARDALGERLMTGEPDSNGSELTRAGSLGTLIGADLAGRLHDRSDVCQSSSDVRAMCQRHEFGSGS